jgi:hypothetical protein
MVYELKTPEILPAQTTPEVDKAPKLEGSFETFIHLSFGKMPKAWRSAFVKSLILRGILNLETLMKPKNIQSLAAAIYDQHRSDGRKLCELARKSDKDVSGKGTVFTVPLSELYSDVSAEFAAQLEKLLPIYGVSSRGQLADVQNMHAVAQALRDIAGVDASVLVGMAFASKQPKKLK